MTVNQPPPRGVTWATYAACMMSHRATDTANGWHWRFSRAVVFLPEECALRIAGVCSQRVTSVSVASRVVVCVSLPVACCAVACPIVRCRLMLRSPPFVPSFQVAGHQFSCIGLSASLFPSGRAGAVPLTLATDWCIVSGLKFCGTLAPHSVVGPVRDQDGVQRLPTRAVGRRHFFSGGGLA